MNQLEQRLLILEQSVGTDEVNIIESIYNAQVKIKDTLRQQNIYQKVQRLTQAIMNYDANYSTEALTQANKANLIARAEPQLIESKELLEKIVKNKKYLDFEPIIQLSTKISEILVLQTTSKVGYEEGKGLVVNQMSQTLLIDEFNAYQQQLEALVKANYELKLLIQS